jgi:hypothetical protein
VIEDPHEKDMPRVKVPSNDEIDAELELASMSDRPPIRLKLSDGSFWPRPAMESDEYQGVGWKCRYSPESLTREDLLQLASIADAYGYLLLETTQKRRDFVCREARRWVTTAGGMHG